MKKSMVPLILLFSMLSCINNISTHTRDFEDKIKELAISIKSSYKNKDNQVKRLAVMPFINEGGQRSHLGTYISNSVQEYIFDTSKFELLERERVDSLLDEYRFNSSGLVSNLSMKNLGSLLGADIVVLGTVSQDHNLFKVSSRLVDLQSGSVLAISHIILPSNKYLKQKFNDIIVPKAVSINGAYELIVKSIEVKDIQRDGSFWDVDPVEPDIYFLVYKNDTLCFPGDVFLAHVDNNTYKASFDQIKAKIVLENDDIIKIVVMDKDHAYDDFIGKIILSPSKILRIINKSENTYSFDNVEKMEISINRIE